MAAHKESCGGCPKCQPVANPYDEQVKVVWHDPTEYNMTQHGPPYLRDKLASTKLPDNERVVVRAHLAEPKVQEFLLKQAEALDAFPTDGEPLRPMSWLLAAMRTLAHVHQTHHWQTHAGHFYADHLLFERLYAESQEFIDGVAERTVGSGSIALVDARRQFDNMHKILHMCYASFGEVASPDQMMQASLMGETLFLGFLKKVMEMLEASGSLSHGISNLLEGVADKHEVFVYLLKQRTTTASVKTASAYSYDRR